METKQGTFVLKGNIKNIGDYVGETIVVIGELEDEVSIFMRGYFIDVEDYYLLRNRDLVTYNVDDDTTITVDGNKAKLSTIKPGDYAQIRAYEDGLAVEIKVNSSKAKIKEWEKEREKQRNTIKTETLKVKLYLLVLIIHGITAKK